MINDKTPKKLLKSLKDIEKLIEIAKKHDLDKITVEGVEISMPRLAPPQATMPKVDTRTQAEREEDELFSDKWQATQ